MTLVLDVGAPVAVKLGSRELAARIQALAAASGIHVEIVPV